MEKGKKPELPTAPKQVLDPNGTQGKAATKRLVFWNNTVNRLALFQHSIQCFGTALASEHAPVETLQWLVAIQAFNAERREFWQSVVDATTFCMERGELQFSERATRELEILEAFECQCWALRRGLENFMHSLVNIRPRSQSTGSNTSTVRPVEDATQKIDQYKVEDVVGDVASDDVQTPKPEATLMEDKGKIKVVETASHRDIDSSPNLRSWAHILDRNVEDIRERGSPVKRAPVPKRPKELQPKSVEVDETSGSALDKESPDLVVGFVSSKESAELPVAIPAANDPFFDAPVVSSQPIQNAAGPKQYATVIREAVGLSSSAKIAIHPIKPMEAQTSIPTKELHRENVISPLNAISTDKTSSWPQDVHRDKPVLANKVTSSNSIAPPSKFWEKRPDPVIKVASSSQDILFKDNRSAVKGNLPVLTARSTETSPASRNVWGMNNTFVPRSEATPEEDIESLKMMPVLPPHKRTHFPKPHEIRKILEEKELPKKMSGVEPSKPVTTNPHDLPLPKNVWGVRAVKAAPFIPNQPPLQSDQGIIPKFAANRDNTHQEDIESLKMMPMLPPHKRTLVREQHQTPTEPSNLSVVKENHPVTTKVSKPPTKSKVAAMAEKEKKDKGKEELVEINPSTVKSKGKGKHWKPLKYHDW